MEPQGRGAGNHPRDLAGCVGVQHTSCMGTPQGLVARVGNLDAEQVVEMAPLGVLRVGMGSLGVTPPEPFRAGTRVMGFAVPRAG